MAKKKKTKKAQSSEILTSAHNIWLAGLGAVARAGEEGSKLFNDLVERGKGVEVQLSEPMERAGSSLRGTVKDVQKRAGKTWKSIEVAVDDQVGAALGKIGVPTRDEIKNLTKRVEELSSKFGLGGKKKTAKRKTTAKKTAKKSAKKTARKTAKKKVVKKKAAKKAG